MFLIHYSKYRYIGAMQSDKVSLKVLKLSREPVNAYMLPPIKPRDVAVFLKLPSGQGSGELVWLACMAALGLVKVILV